MFKAKSPEYIANPLDIAYPVANDITFSYFFLVLKSLVKKKNVERRLNHLIINAV